MNLKNHPLLDFHDDISGICAPLLQQLNFSIVNFIRLYHNQDVFYLCDNRDWLQHYLKSGYPAIGAFENNKIFREQKFVLWDSLDNKDPIVIYSREQFNIKYGITFIKPFNGGYDFFNLGVSTNSPAVLEKLSTQIEPIEKFISIFYEKAKKIIAFAKKNCLQLQQFGYVPAHVVVPERFYLGPTYNYQYLTYKEIIYLKGLLTGMTVPEIAKMNHISPRTIEKHIENIKQKVNCRTQYELGYTIAKLDIDFSRYA